MNKLFISPSSQDEAFVRDLRAALADHGQERRIDRANCAAMRAGSKRLAL